MRSQSNSVKNLSLFICFGDLERPADLKPTQNSVLQKGPCFSAMKFCSPPKGNFIPSMLIKGGLVLYNHIYFQHMLLHNVFMKVWGSDSKEFWISKPRCIQHADQGIGNMGFVLKMKVKLPLFWSHSLQIKDMTAHAILCEKRVRSTKHFEPRSDIIHFIWSVLVSSQNERNTKRSWVSAAFGFLFKSEALKTKGQQGRKYKLKLKKETWRSPREMENLNFAGVSSAVMTRRLSSPQSGKL